MTEGEKVKPMSAAGRGRDQKQLEVPEDKTLRPSDTMDVTAPATLFTEELSAPTPPSAPQVLGPRPRVRADPPQTGLRAEATGLGLNTEPEPGLRVPRRRP